jgi:hypothetical protein
MNGHEKGAEVSLIRLAIAAAKEGVRPKATPFDAKQAKHN